MIFKLNEWILVKIPYSRNLTSAGAAKVIAMTHTRQQVLFKISAIILRVFYCRSQRKFLGARLRDMLDSGTGVKLIRTAWIVYFIRSTKTTSPTPIWSPSSTWIPLIREALWASGTTGRAVNVVRVWTSFFNLVSSAELLLLLLFFQKQKFRLVIIYIIYYVWF